MGHIHEDHGRITIETRRESFKIHASYGYKQAMRPIGILKPGDSFDVAGVPWTVYGVFTDKVQATRNEDDHLEDFSLDSLVGIDDQDEDESCALGRLWRNNPHPEFANEDLDDLIAALLAVRASASPNFAHDCV